ncbi:MAG: phosphoribosylanthranilate isomerase [Candidatus Acidiferrales bacterium]
MVRSCAVLRLKSAMVKVKICGITNWTDARRAAEAGADFLGFNFYRRSPRHITPGAARKIARRLPRGIAIVGVFVNETEEQIAQIARRVGLDFIQLHGDEPPAAIARLRRVAPVIRAVRVRRAIRPAQLHDSRAAFAILLDGFDGRRYGGTGNKFSWGLLRHAKIKKRIFLAGGLNPGNIAGAIRACKPFAVDVCSGVEAKPGKKDAALLKALMGAVRSTKGNSR